MKTIELLAPAGNLEIGAAAVDCGADAVYIGAERFGARAAASNSVADIEKLAVYAHKYGAKVYVALNTILTDDELPRAVAIAGRVWNAGADALIIQDMGLLEADMPPIPVIASTQTCCDTPEKVLFMEKAGFKRVILPREMTLNEIKTVRAVSCVELEAFVHGALCVSCGGRCYLSYAVGGRSGNRGNCAQPCRKSYSCSDAEGAPVAAGNYPLSLRDLNLSKRLGDLADAGITSFKIEGRLKDTAYVKNVVAFYRAELDKVLKNRGMDRASRGISFPGFIPDLRKTFNRGYTQYFLDGNPSDVASPDSPKFTGEPLGTAFEIRDGSFKVRGAGLLHPGDGISFFDKNAALSGSLVNGVKDGRVRADNLKGLENGSEIFRNYDRIFIQGVKHAASVRKFAVKMEFYDYSGGFVLKASDERGLSAEVKISCVKSPARNPEQAAETVKRQLSKLGDSVFTLAGLDVKLSAAYFLPVSSLNDMRREVLSKLEKKELPYERELRPMKKTRHKYPETPLDFRANITNSQSAAFYARHGVKKTEKAAECGADLTDRPVMALRYCIRRRLGLCRKGREPAGPLFLQDAEGNRLRMEFDCSSCRIQVYLESSAAGCRKTE